MLNGLNNIVNFLNGYIWGVGMLVLIVGSGLYFTIRLHGFQFVHFKDMWSRIIDKQDSDSGISAFGSFCTTMAMRVGTGNVAGVAVAIYMGGPGALFWMILAGMTNSAVCFAECTLAVLYKTRIDGQYRGGGAYCAERGLGWKKYGAFMALILMIGTSVFMPAAATYTICDGFHNAIKIPMWVSALIIALILAVVVIGGVKRISAIASMIVPFMVTVYLIAAVVIIVMNITAVPALIKTVVTAAFAKNAVFGGTIGVIIQQGVKRGTFSSASGMGEASPTAAAAETSHPVKQGMANAAGVWLDTVIICTASGLMILLTDCFNTAGGYVGVWLGGQRDFSLSSAIRAFHRGGTGFCMPQSPACPPVRRSAVHVLLHLWGCSLQSSLVRHDDRYFPSFHPGACLRLYTDGNGTGVAAFPHRGAVLYGGGVCPLDFRLLLVGGFHFQPLLLV